MLKFFFYQSVFRLVNYFLLNPYARKALGLGCLGIIVFWLALTIATVIVNAIGTMFISLETWYARATFSPLVIAFITLILVGIVAAGVLFQHPTLRKQLRHFCTKTRQVLTCMSGRGSPESLGDRSISIENKIILLDSPDDETPISEFIVIHKDNEQR